MPTVKTFKKASKETPQKSLSECIKLNKQKFLFDFVWLFLVLRLIFLATVFIWKVKNSKIVTIVHTKTFHNLISLTDK